jgi:hypothetical protein
MNRIIFFILLFCGCGSIYGQYVKVDGASVEGENIIVRYTISGAKFNQEFSVYLYVSRDGGITYEGPLKMVAGDVGAGIKKGSHRITWEVLKEMPFTEQELVFDVRAEVIQKPIRRSVFIAYVGNTMTPFGLRVGTLGKIGFYGEGRFNLLGFEKYSYTWDNDALTDWDKAGYYEFTDFSGYSAYSAVGGLTFQPGWNVFLYTGVGYGKEENYFEVDEFTYEDDAKTGSSYVKDMEHSVSGKCC